MTFLAWHRSQRLTLIQRIHRFLGSLLGVS